MGTSDGLWKETLKYLSNEWRNRRQKIDDPATELDEIVALVIKIINTGDRIKQQKEYDIHHPKG